MKKNKNIFIVNNQNFNSSSQEGATLKVLIENKNKKMTTQEITDVASKEYEKITGKKYREVTGRAIRKLAEKGLIHRDGRGIFYYNGIFKGSTVDEFSEKQKAFILKRDNYTCQFCGKSKKNGALLTVDHLEPQSKYGKADVENGMVLCAACENRKSNYDLNTFGKKMFEKFYKKALKKNDKKSIKFLKEIIEVFEKHNQI